MARGHQKELSRQRNDKNGGSNKPTTQKGTAGKKISNFPYESIFSLMIFFSRSFNLSMCCL